MGQFENAARQVTGNFQIFKFTNFQIHLPAESGELNKER